MDNLFESLDRRMNDLIIDFYRYKSEFMREDRKSRMLEVANIAETAGMISFDDWHVIMNMLFSIGTDDDMEERLS